MREDKSQLWDTDENFTEGYLVGVVQKNFG